MSSLRKLLKTIQVVQTSKGMKSLRNVGGVVDEPGLEICISAMQRLFCAPYDWKFNKYEIPPFTTIAYQQDYKLSGCTVFCKGRYVLHVNAVGSPNGNGLTQSGSVVTAQFNDFAPNGMYQGTGPSVGDVINVRFASQAGYNVIGGVITAVLSPTSFQYIVPTTGLTPDGGQGFGSPGINWLMAVSFADFQSSSNVIPVHDGEAVSSLPMESIIQPPYKFAIQRDEKYTFTPATPGAQTQTVTVPIARGWPVPSSQIWAVYLFYQGKAPQKFSLEDTWDPWPDDLSFVTTAMVKAAALDWWEDPRAANSYALAELDIAKALGSKDQELRSQSMFPDLPIMRGG